jgi:2-dehydro-3-deoxyphosphogluconate aldolase/(4S)-4-hydroxy-2-oxoglutarate aldolase
VTADRVRRGRLEVLSAILEVGAVPLFSSSDPDLAAEVVLACRRGGARAVEFTDRAERAYPAFVRLAEALRARDPEAILGVGSVTDAPTAALYLAAGAQFVVSPTFEPELARLCNRRKVAYLPGCATPTEIALAEQAGAEIVKLFPADPISGPAFVKAVLGPSPWTRVMPTGGIRPTREAVEAWIGAGAAALGFGSQLISAAVLAERRFDELAAALSEVVGYVGDARRRASAV